MDQVLSIVTFKPRDSKIEAVEVAAIPLPKDDTTPPVIKIYFSHANISFFELKTRVTICPSLWPYLRLFNILISTTATIYVGVIAF